MKNFGKRVVAVMIMAMVFVTTLVAMPVYEVVSGNSMNELPEINTLSEDTSEKATYEKRDYDLAAVFSARPIVLDEAERMLPVSYAAVNYGEEEIITPETIDKVNSLDYFVLSSTGLTSEAYSKTEISERIADYARFEGNPGMPVAEYAEAMNAKWEDCTDYENDPEVICLDISESYTYDNLVEMMVKLSAYDGVYLYKIGETTEGRDMYAIEIDVPSDEEKKTIVLTGNVHAREIAGSVFVLKELIDLIQDDSEEAVQVLSNIRIAAVTCVNPDGRDGVAFDTNNYTYADGQLWKATSNGTDLNRNFPGLSWGQIGKGYSKSPYNAKSADCIYYPGDYAGSCSETKAMMKFLYHYVVVEKAEVLIDYHQQGRLSYAGKPWDREIHQKACRKLSDTMFSVMNVGNSHKYYWEKEESSYGLCGQGSTLTDYACSIAYGAKFSPAYGFCVYTDGEKEYPLCMIPRMDKNKAELIDEPNPDFVTMTFEIGYGRAYLGYSKDTRACLAKEYSDYRFDRVIYELKEYLNKKD